MLRTGQKETAKLQPKCNESGDKSLIFFYLQLSKRNKLSNSAMCSSPLFPSPKSIVLKGQVEEKRTIGPVLFLPAGGWVVQVGSTARRRRWWSLYWDLSVVCRKGRGGETHWEDVQMKQGLQHHDYIKEWFYEKYILKRLLGLDCWKQTNMQKANTKPQTSESPSSESQTNA